MKTKGVGLVGMPGFELVNCIRKRLTLRHLQGCKPVSANTRRVEESFRAHGRLSCCRFYPGMLPMMPRLAAAVALLVAAACAPTAPTNAAMSLAIGQSTLPVGGTTTVTATIRGLSGAPIDQARVMFTSSVGSFEPIEAIVVAGVATSAFTATKAGTGTISALSGSVAAEHLMVRVGEAPAPPPVIVAAAPPVTIFVSCSTGTAGAPTICMVSGLSLQAVVMNWGDGTPEQSLNPNASTAAHVFARAGTYTVVARGVDASGQSATANATATIVNAPTPPPPVTPPAVAISVGISQEANASGGCAAFNVSAQAATGATISSMTVTKAGATIAGPFSTTSARFAVCSLVVNDILTATATDSKGGTATYQLLVK